MDTAKTAIKEAIRQAGGPVALAAKLGITSQAVSQWSRAPATRVIDIEAETNVSRYRLRPDIFGRKPTNGAPA